MNLSLFISFAIIAAGLLGAVYYNRFDAFLDNMLKGLGKLARDILKYTLYGLFVLLFIGAIYAVFTWATTGSDPTFDSTVQGLVQEGEQASDYLGNLINGDSNSAPGVATSAIATPSPQLTTSGSTYPAGAIVYDLRPTPLGASGNAAMDAYELNRGVDFAAGLGSPCNRHINPSGNCFGLSRFFVNENFVNSCNKVYVRAPQKLYEQALVNIAY